MCDDDDDGCIICDEYQVSIQGILDDNIPVASAPVQASNKSVALSLVDGVAAAVDRVVLQRAISEGENSSGKSLIISGLYIAAHTTDQVPVVIKISDKTHFARAQKEYSMMSRLSKSDSSRFVRPFCLLDGGSGNIIPYLPEDATYCSNAVCIVMEKGSVDMKEYLSHRSDMQVTEKLSVVRHMLDILIASRKCNIVLNDFKPANIIRVSDGRYDFTLKAIDFDNTKEEGEIMSDEVTAPYATPEVAKIALAKLKGHTANALPSSHKCDVMALGWTVYEIANNMKSYWANQETPIVGDVAILTALSNLKDETVAADIELTFPGTKRHCFFCSLNDFAASRCN